MLVDYIKYLFKAKTLHGTHSPFIYNFYQNVFSKDFRSPAFDHIEKHRRDLQKSKISLNFEDFGAGSLKSGELVKKSVASIASKSLKRAKWGRAFHRILTCYPSSIVLELGTSLGITTAYLAMANRNASIHSFEGSKEVLNLASTFFKNEKLNNIYTHLGNVDDTLPSFLKTAPVLGFVYLDANHRLEPTLRYFNQLFPYLNEDSILVFDDIYWSTEMTQAWEIIKKDERVRQTIDLFEVGIVFFRKNQVKEHFVLRY